MKYKIRDLQFAVRYFGGNEGIIFNSKKEILEQLVSYHNNDYSGVRENDTYYKNIEQMFKENNITELQKQLEWILDYGQWGVEKV